MEKTIILHGLNLKDLLDQIDLIIEKRLDEKLSQIKQKPEAKILTRKEAAHLLKISLPTLDQWTKNDLITSYRIATRILYKSEDIEKAILKRQFK